MAAPQIAYTDAHFHGSDTASNAPDAIVLRDAAAGAAIITIEYTV